MSARKKSPVTNGPTDVDRALAADLGVGFYVASEDGRPHPSLGALLWGAREIDRVTGPDAIGKVIQPK